jgi:1,4-alpha-glucan branching enzyme
MLLRKTNIATPEKDIDILHFSRQICNGVRHLPLFAHIRYDSSIVEKFLGSETKGYFSLVLHAHLPYIRHPENEDQLEERWLYEAITESYIPLLRLFGDLLNDGVDFRVTLSLTPTLIEMFNDDLLISRYERYLDRLIELSEKEIWRTRKDRRFRPVARMYRDRFVKTRHVFENVYRKDLTAAFRALSGSGKIEIITSAATHPFLPALMPVRSSARAQIMVGSEYFRRTFGKKPEGMWLPECGFTPEMDPLLREAGVKFFFLESHGLLGGSPPCRHGIYSPVKTPSGVIAFSRDVDSSRQVWSAMEGYPGDPDYRDFFRDIGFDLGTDYIDAYLPDGIRTFTGIKYYRITGKSDIKKPYIRRRALQKARLHAAHFSASKNDQVAFLRTKLGIRPIITAAYDAELFGHWWFEGPEWLNSFLRNGARGVNSFRFVTPSEYIAGTGETETSMPSMSSWGDGGYCATWVNPSNDWVYRHLTKAARSMRQLARANRGARGLLKRALNQAARELLLAQASDWTFMMKTGNASGFAERKFAAHINNFLDLQREIDSGRIHARSLTALENKNNIFHDIDYRIYGE